jgi:hypothetical protein
VVDGAVADLHSRQMRERWSQIDRHPFWRALDMQPRYDGTVGSDTLVAPLLDDLQRYLGLHEHRREIGEGSSDHVHESMLVDTT